MKERESGPAAVSSADLAPWVEAVKALKTCPAESGTVPWILQIWLQEGLVHNL